MRTHHNLRTLVGRTLLGLRFPFALSFDVTNRCNLRCRHCYFHRQEHGVELTDDQVLAEINRTRARHPWIDSAGWVGGEPLLRPELLTECTRLFGRNMIVTNGTFPLPALSRCVFNVSIDGTREIHDAIRGEGVYHRAKANVDRDDVCVNIACVINRINSGCIEELVDEWRGTSVRGISFGFYTPDSASIDDPLYLGGSERDAVVDRLLVLKKAHGGFIVNSRSVLALMRSGISREVTTRCLAPSAFVSIDASGNVKRPCVMGPRADCARCGCAVAFELDSVINRWQPDTMLSAARFSSSAACRPRRGQSPRRPRR